MLKPELDSPRAIAGAKPVAATLERPGDGEPGRSSRPKPPAIFYVGFQTTRDGREYTLRVSGGTAQRVFVMLIENEAFASRAARFQDAPDLCFGRLQRELLADPDLLPGARLVLTAQELLDYQIRGAKRPPVRTRRQPIDQNAESSRNSMGAPLPAMTVAKSASLPGNRRWM